MNLLWWAPVSLAEYTLDFVWFKFLNENLPKEPRVEGSTVITSPLPLLMYEYDEVARCVSDATWNDIWEVTEKKMSAQFGTGIPEKRFYK